MVNIFIVQWMKTCRRTCFNCVDKVEHVSKKCADIAVRKPKTFYRHRSEFYDQPLQRWCTRARKTFTML